MITPFFRSDLVRCWPRVSGGEEDLPLPVCRQTPFGLLHHDPAICCDGVEQPSDIARPTTDANTSTEQTPQEDLLRLEKERSDNFALHISKIRQPSWTALAALKPRTRLCAEPAFAAVRVWDFFTGTIVFRPGNGLQQALETALQRSSLDNAAKTGDKSAFHANQRGGERFCSLIGKCGFVVHPDDYNVVDKKNPLRPGGIKKEPPASDDVYVLVIPGRGLVET